MFLEDDGILAEPGCADTTCVSIPMLSPSGYALNHLINASIAVNIFTKHKAIHTRLPICIKVMLHCFY